MTQAEIDLSPFCGTEGRYAIRDPWVFKGWRYATDGKIAVRTPSSEPDTKWEKGTIAPPAQDIFSQYPGKQWQAWPDGPYVIRFIKCETCEGRGETFCDHCENWGKCADCDGKKGSMGQSHLVVADRWIKLAYCELIRVLPSIEFSPDTPSNRPLPFRFMGGEGVVMPMNKED